MILTVMSKEFGQISYSIPEDTKNLCVSIEDDGPFILRNHEDIIEPLKSFTLKDGEIVRLDPVKEVQHLIQK